CFRRPAKVAGGDAEGHHNAADNQAPDRDNRGDNAEDATPTALFLFWLFLARNRVRIWQVPSIRGSAQRIPCRRGGAAVGEGVAIDRLELRQVNVLITLSLGVLLWSSEQTCWRVRGRLCNKYHAPTPAMIGSSMVSEPEEKMSGRINPTAKMTARVVPRPFSEVDLPAEFLGRSFFSPKASSNGEVDLE